MDRLTDVTLDDPRREPDPAPTPRRPEPDVGIRPDGYLLEPPHAEPADDRQPSGNPIGWPDGTQEDPGPRLVIRDRGRYLGMVACVLAAMLFITNVVGIVLSNTGSDEAAFTLALITIFGTILTFVGGLIAAVLDFGRAWGVAAVVLSVLGNPFVLVVLLGTFTGAVR